MNEVVVEGMLVVAAGRAYVASRPLVLARPRRGSADLPDRDGPERTPPESSRARVRLAPADRWVVPASVGLAAVLGTIVARAAIVLI